MVEQRILEAAQRAPHGAVTGWAALRLYGAAYFDGLAPDGSTVRPVDIVIIPPANLRPAPEIRVLREAVPPHDIGTACGLTVTSAERATFDEARQGRGLREAVVVLDTALAACVVSRQTMARYVASRAGSRGVRQVAAALRLAEDRSMSPMESVLRLIWCLDAQLPRPRLNWPVADASGRFIGRPDLLSTELAVIGEFDGSRHRTRDQHREDLRRDDRFRAVGLETFRVVGADLGDSGLVLDRIKTAVERSRTSTVPRTWSLQANPRPVT